MPTGRPQTALAAITWRRLPVSRWPWQSAGYLLAALPLAVAAAASLAIPAAPWLALAAGRYPAGAAVLLVLLGAALTAVLGPVIAIPAAGLARARLRLADARPGSPRHRQPPAAGLVPWLRARYSDPAAWREVACTCLLATVVPVLSAAALLVLPVAGILIASPFLVAAQGTGGQPVALGADKGGKGGKGL